MIIVDQTIPLDCNIILWGDDHWGDPFRCNDACMDFMSILHTKHEGVKHNFFVHHGDIIHGILLDDKRASKDIADEPFVITQAQEAVAFYKKSAKQIVLILEGNHPLKLWRFGNITKTICSELGVTYGTWSAIINYKDAKGKMLFRHYCTHGARTFNSVADDIARRKTNIRLSIKRALRDKASDCYLMTCGHAHILEVCEPEERLTLITDGKKIRQRYTSAMDWHTAEYIPEDQRHYVCCGSSSRLYVTNSTKISYAERLGYNPIDLGCAIVMVRGGKIAGIKKRMFNV